jgi:hypothetical protein
VQVAYIEAINGALAFKSRNARLMLPLFPL